MRISTKLALRCALAVTLLIAGASVAHAGDVTGQNLSLFMDALRDVGSSYAVKVGDLVHTLLLPFAGIFGIWTVLDGKFTKKPYKAIIWDILWPLAIVTFFCNESNYKEYLSDDLWCGLKDELILQAGPGANDAFDIAVSNLYDKQAHSESTGYLGALLNRFKEAAGLFDPAAWLTWLIGFCSIPLMWAALCLHLMELGFLLGIGPICILFFLFPWTRGWTLKWFSSFMGSAFSIAAIAFYIPVLTRWSDLITVAQGSSPSIAAFFAQNFVWSIAGVAACWKAGKVGKSLF